MRLTAFLRELVRAETLDLTPEEPRNGAAREKPTLVRWLLQPERLPPAALEISPVASKGPGFLATLFASERLPLNEPAHPGPGFLTWILARETLPCAAQSDSATRGPSFLHWLLSSETLGRRDDELAQ